MNKTLSVFLTLLIIALISWCVIKDKNSVDIDSRVYKSTDQSGIDSPESKKIKFTSKTFKDPNGNFRVDYPSTWTYATDSTFSTTVGFYPPGKTDNSITMIIMYVDMVQLEEGKRTPEEIINSFLSQNPNLNYESINLSGVSGYVLKSPGSESYAVAKNGKLYNILYNAPVDEFSTYREGLLEILSTFTFLK